ncbi:MAG: hypothetical protein ABIJ59_18255 [Pseudomonadota bacterium]
MTNQAFTLLFDLYHTMDAAWNTTAKAYSFKCNGCKDNCCTSLFYHYTHIEQAYLLHGFQRLKPDKRSKVLNLAKAYCEKTFDHGDESKSLKILCPVNKDGRCQLYQYRPMICRLHGLPHELNRPGNEPVKGPGCDAGQFNTKDYVRFDRTPFYQQMAQIEIAFRQNTNLSGKLKMTIAQILLSE